MNSIHEETGREYDEDGGRTIHYADGTSVYTPASLRGVPGSLLREGASMTHNAAKILARLQQCGHCTYTHLRHVLGEIRTDFRTVKALDELATAGLAERRTLKVAPGHDVTHWCAVEAQVVR